MFGEAFLQAGDTERDLGLRYAEAWLKNLGPLAGPDAPSTCFNLRLREGMREAKEIVEQAELTEAATYAGSQPVTVGFVDIVGFTRLGEDVAPEERGTARPQLREGRERRGGGARQAR